MIYRVLENNLICIFVKPVIKDISSDYNIDQGFYMANESDSFDYFNYKVLIKSVHLLRGRLELDSNKLEYSLNVPIKCRKSKK